MWPIVQSDLLESKPPNFVLIVEQSSNVQFSIEIGPFQSARLIFYLDGEWRLDSPILEHQKVAEGRLSCPVDTTELVNIAQKWLSKTHVLCPGLVGLDGHDLQKELGYFPKNVRMLNSKSLYSKSCRIWHVPGGKLSQSRFRPSSEDVWRMSCLRTVRENRPR